MERVRYYSICCIGALGFAGYSFGLVVWGAMLGLEDKAEGAAKALKPMFSKKKETLDKNDELNLE